MMPDCLLKTLSFFICLLGFTAFSQNVNTPISALNSTAEKVKFLEAVYHTNRAIEAYEDSVMYASGFRSEAHLGAIDSLNLVDSLLSGRIDQYLSFYNYPNREELGEKATLAPWLVLQESENRSLRLKHFNKLFDAVEDENLEDRRVVEFLEKQYKLTFHKRFQSYAVEQKRMGELMQALDLKPKRARRLAPGLSGSRF